MNKKVSRNTLTPFAGLLFLSVLVNAKSFAISAQYCDEGTKQACCSVEQYRNLSMWVKSESCPKGMKDDSSCTLQYGCKADKP